MPSQRLREQVRRKSLATHGALQYFQLRPDFLVEKHSASQFVLDAKWKLLDSRKSGPDKKYGMSQADLYQLYAYGHKYLPEGAQQKTVCLIYPMTEIFHSPLKPFDFEPGYRLLVLPFDLVKCRLVDGSKICA